jgi:hypothetical protein
LSVQEAKIVNEVAVDPHYERLLEVLMGALDQAANGKGRERHATGEPFEQQICCYLLRHAGIGGAVFQVCKKALEACRLPYPANVAELRGAINYAASAIIELERQQGSDHADRIDLFNLSGNGVTA